jgi:Uma2 family endonuclease
MGMPTHYEKWTVDLLDALPPSSDRFELIDGELYVTPSPGFAHQSVVSRLAAKLIPYVLAVGGCEAIVSPSDLWRSPREENRIQPDIYVVRHRDGRLPSYPFHLSELLLAVEVLSPSSAWTDREVKRRVYLDEGVAEYWAVDLDERSVTRWRKPETAELFTASIDWRPRLDVAPLVIELPSLFEALRRS